MRRVKSFKLFWPPKFDAFAHGDKQHLLSRCVDEAASEHFERTAFNPSLSQRSCAPAAATAPCAGACNGCRSDRVPPALNRSHAVGAAECRLCVRRGLSPPPPDGWRRGGARRRFRRCAAGARPRTRAHSALSRPLLLLTAAVSVLSGTSTCVAEAVGGGSSTPRVPLVAAATMGAAADLTAGRHGWPRSLSGGARLRYCCYCVRVCV